MADAGMNPCEGRQGSDCSQGLLQWQEQCIKTQRPCKRGVGNYCPHHCRRSNADCRRAICQYAVLYLNQTSFKERLAIASKGYFSIVSWFFKELRVPLFVKKNYSISKRWKPSSDYCSQIKTFIKSKTTSSIQAKLQSAFSR